MAMTLFVLGILGSFGHCVGMCTPVTLLLTRPAQQVAQGPSLRAWLFLLHTGRLVAYAVLGTAVALLGQALAQAAPQMRYLQGGLALIIALVLMYMALAAAGRVPSVEMLFTGLTRRWGQAVRQLTVLPHPRLYHALPLGIMWGLLPCGLVYSALLIAASTAHPWQAALGMMLFGLGTVPIMMGVGWAGVHGRLPSREPLRYLAAGVIFLFGVQMALRGLAAWGWVAHVRVGGIMLW